MVGKTYMYVAVNHRIIAVKESEEKIYISTDKDLLVFPAEKAEDIIGNKFLEVDSDSPDANTGLVVFGQLKAGDLAAVLKNNITRLQTDPDFIKQAGAINSTINTLLNLVKTEISARKMAGK
jgi:hypothetical protein